MLQAGEHRYEVEMAPWEEYASALPPGTPWKRFCVKQLRTNDNVVEVSHCRSPGPLPLLTIATTSAAAIAIIWSSYVAMLLQRSLGAQHAPETAQGLACEGRTF